MNVSIIIVNYNTRQLLANCLDSIKEKTIGVEYEVIVVDNDSQDDSVSLIKDNYPWVKLIEAGGNLGFGRANNLGFNAACGKYIFLLNSDTILLNNAVLMFFEFMELHNSDNSIGAIGGVLLDVDNKPTMSFGDFPSINSEWNYIKNKIKDKLLNKNTSSSQLLNESVFDVDYIIGADLFIPKFVIEKIGLFDADFFMYYEETDLQKRMDLNGYKRMIIPHTKIIHLEGGSITSSFKFSYKRFALSQTSLHIYIKKHFKGINYLSFRVFMMFIRLTILFESRFTTKEKLKSLKLIFFTN
ncbi:glycosyltransferase family 2 protein [Flavobacterium ovatum]|uniref:glycosyltransferase family 2 protein n=1 Tax=Flavobacterium ovatum TaxID=1928857 RepID=UPI00344EC753